MRLQNKDGKTYSSHVINAAIVEVKLPNLGKGKSWKEKTSKIGDTSVTLMYNESRSTGVYFKYNDNVNYVREREILDESSLTVLVSEPKAKLTDEEKAARRETRQAETRRNQLTKMIEKMGRTEAKVASAYTDGRAKKFADMTLVELDAAKTGLKEEAAEAAKAERQKKADQAKKDKEAQAKAAGDTGAA